MTTTVVMGSEALTDLQLAVMKALWEIGEGTLGEVVAAMARAGRDLAPTTVATMLQRLGKQGWVAHRKNGRQLSYRAKVGEKDAAKSMVERVVQSFFGGRVSALAAQLLESEDLTAEDLAAMRKLVAKKGG